MIVRGIKRILKSDIPEAPGWLEKLLNPLNEFLDNAVGALRNKLTFGDNFYCNIKEFDFTHAEELQVGHSLDAYKGLLVLSTPQMTSADYAIVGWKARIIDKSTLGVVVYFQGAGSTKGPVKICILG